MRLAVVLAAAVAGAALLAGLNPAPRDAYVAAGALVVVADPGAPAATSAQTLQAAEVLTLPAVVAEAAERSLLVGDGEGVRRRLDVVPRPEAGVVRYSVRGATPETAVRLGEALGRVAAEVLRVGRPPGDRFGLRVVGDFELDADGWRPAGSEAGLALVGVVPEGRYGGSALRVQCDVAAGCGAARTLEGRFSAGRPLRLSAWVRGRQPSRVLVSLGSADRVDRMSAETLVGRGWRRLAVTWRPRRDENRISLSITNPGPSSADVDIDGVVLVIERALLSGSEERRLFAARDRVYAASVRIVGVKTGPTFTWAVRGGAAGLLVGLAAVAAWTAAVGRRRRAAI